MLIAKIEPPAGCRSCPCTSVTPLQSPHVPRPKVERQIPAMAANFSSSARTTWRTRNCRRIPSGPPTLPSTPAGRLVCSASRRCKSQSQRDSDDATPSRAPHEPELLPIFREFCLLGGLSEGANGSNGERMRSRSCSSNLQGIPASRHFRVGTPWAHEVDRP